MIFLHCGKVDEKFLSLKLVSEKGLDLMAILFCEYMMMDPFATDPQWSLPIQKRPVFMKNYESFDCQEKLCKKWRTTKNEENLSFGKSLFFEGTSAKFKVLFFQMIYIRLALYLVIWITLILREINSGNVYFDRFVTLQSVEITQRFREGNGFTKEITE